MELKTYFLLHPLEKMRKRKRNKLN